MDQQDHQRWHLVTECIKVFSKVLCNIKLIPPPHPHPGRRQDYYVLRIAWTIPLQSLKLPIWHTVCYMNDFFFRFTARINKVIGNDPTGSSIGQSIVVTESLLNLQRLIHFCQNLSPTVDWFIHDSVLSIINNQVSCFNPSLHWFI